MKDARAQVVLSSFPLMKGKGSVGMDVSCELTSDCVTSVAESTLAFVTICPFPRNDRQDPSDKMG